MSVSIRSRANRLNDLLLRAEEYFGVVLIAGVFVLLLAQVIMRYALPSSFPWIEEVARLLFVWTVLIGAGFAVGRQSHITVTAISDALLKSRSYIAVVGGLVISALVGVLMALASWELVQTLGHIRASSSGLSRGLFYLPGVIGFSLVTVHSLLLLVSGKYRVTAETEVPEV